MFEPGLHALPIGVDFPDALVRGLITRFSDQPPEAMARVTLYLNAGRMQRAVKEAFDRHGDGFVPRIRLITDLGNLPMPGLPAPIPKLRRRLELAQLVEQFIGRLPGFESGAGIFALADSLAELMAEMQVEGVTPDDLAALEIESSHAAHWQFSLAFIRIVARYFADSAELDAEARQRKVVETLTERWRAAPPADPVIVAGSTGSRGSTSLFMELVASLPNGAVILPGFDFDMPISGWTSLCSGQIPAEDHPQYRFKALMDRLGLGPSDVKLWTDTRPHAPDRNALVSLAMRPAPVTDQWMSEGKNLALLPETTRDLTLIAAPDPRKEALAIALVLRDALERGETAALITPDRLLTRRVAAALDRWGIRPDDSGGQPLHLSAPGRLLRHVAEARGTTLSIEDLIILLKHPLVATGSTGRGDHLRLTRDLELHLRRYGPAFPDRAFLTQWAARKADDRTVWADWLSEFIESLQDAPKQSLSAVIEAHIGSTAHLVAGPGGKIEASPFWSGPGGAECRAIISELAEQAPFGGEYAAADYADLLRRLLQGGMIRRAEIVNPNVMIWGTLEARVQGADLAVLAGLNEGSWPEATAPDPWLSRKMRLDAGLLLPERQIGLSAHDFQQAVGARRVVLTRASRDAEAETVPSRWLNRLTNLINGLPERQGPEAYRAMCARGDDWLRMVETMERPASTIPPARRPSPRPPVETRPRELPVTSIKTLIRDPYEIYARRILRLRKLDPLRAEPDPRLRGQVLHDVIERFVKSFDPNLPPERLQEQLLLAAQEVFEAEIPFPSAQRLWLARIRKIAESFVADEFVRRTEGTPAIMEEKDSISLKMPVFTLTAKPDRIDILHDGRARILDYKSGTVPSKKQMRSFDKQLLLEAAMAERGAFTKIGPVAVADMTYIRLGGDGETQIIEPETGELDEVWVKFTKLIARYFNPEQGYTARRAMHSVDATSDYDQLSRFGEWELTDPSHAEVLE